MIRERLTTIAIVAFIALAIGMSVWFTVSSLRLILH